MLQQSCEILAGVGPTIGAKLAKCGIYTLIDLLLHLPYRYQDRTRVTAICDLRPNDYAVIVGQVCKVEIKRGKRPMLHCYIEDKSGVLKLSFFHFNQQQVKSFNDGPFIRAFGEVRTFSNSLGMTHPEYQLLVEDEECLVEETLTPIYSSTEGLTQARLRQLINLALKTYDSALAELEWMSAKQLQDYNFYPFAKAVQLLHSPPPECSLLSFENGSHPALQRLLIEELVAQRLSMQFARRHRYKLSAPYLAGDKIIIKRFKDHLTFNLTAAQARVSEEITKDLAQTKPMLRLVQGDVGSGKTVVAALAALQAISSEFQVAFMAPTDLLSDQHANNLQAWLEPLGLRCAKLSGKMKTRERKQVLEQVASGECQLLIGTHALFQEQVVFAKLGLVIIDEQHRFGVEQRLLLQKKGQTEEAIPHQLLMTATPIPRTLAMTQLAHLDLSVIDELPPGRTPIITAIISQEKRASVISRLRTAIKNGQQAYWVCTLIEESEKLQCIAATASAQTLQEQLTDLRIGLIHGRMKANEKEAIMTSFKAGEIDLLVATTVIEVGVDVPNASLMIIENPERLGLAQLHQLRGRVGRGSKQSHCILLYQAPLSHLSAERLRIMRASTDGFMIAEKDLELRGSGEVLGVRQTGYRQFKLVNLQRDKALLPLAATITKKLLTDEPALAYRITTRWLGNFEQFFQS